MNQVVLLSGESASGIEKLVRASAWGDEVIPTTVVVVDNDQAGLEAKKRLIGQARDKEKLLDEAMVCTIDKLFNADGQAVVTSEDLIPKALFEEALRRYIKTWNPDVFEKTAARIKLPSGSKGNLAGAEEVLKSVLDTEAVSVDKMGIAMEVVKMVYSDAAGAALTESIDVLSKRIKELCLQIRRRLSEGQKAERQRSGKQAVQRIIGDFLKIRRFGTNIVDLEELCLRLRREAKFSFGQEGEALEHIMDRWSTRLQDTRSAGQTEFRDAEWETWRSAVDAVKKNPLKPDSEAALRVLGDGATAEENVVPMPAAAKAS